MSNEGFAYDDINGLVSDIVVAYRRNIHNLSEDEISEGKTLSSLFWERITTLYNNDTDEEVMALINTMENNEIYLMEFKKVGGEYSDMYGNVLGVVKPVGEKYEFLSTYTQCVSENIDFIHQLLLFSQSVYIDSENILSLFHINEDSIVYALFEDSYDMGYGISSFVDDCSSKSNYKVVASSAVYSERGSATNIVRGFSQMNGRSYTQYVVDNRYRIDGIKYMYLMSLSKSSENTEYWYFEFYNESDHVCIRTGKWNGIHTLYKLQRAPGDLNMYLPYCLGFSDNRIDAGYNLTIFSVIPDILAYQVSPVTDFRYLVYDEIELAKGESHPYIQSVSESVFGSINNYNRFLKTSEIDANLVDTTVQSYTTNQKIDCLFIFKPAPDEEEYRDCKVQMIYKDGSGERQAENKVFIKRGSAQTPFNIVYEGGNERVLTKESYKRYYGLTSTRIYNFGNCNLPELCYFNVNQSKLIDGYTSQGYPDIFGEDITCTLADRNLFVSYCYASEPNLEIDAANPYLPVLYIDKKQYVNITYEMAYLNYSFLPTGINITDVQNIATDTKVSDFITIGLKEKIFYVLVQVENIDADPGSGVVYFDTAAGLESEDGNNVRKKFYVQLIIDGSYESSNDNDSRLILKYDDGSDGSMDRIVTMDEDPSSGIKFTSADGSVITFDDDGSNTITTNKSNTIFPANTLFNVNGNNLKLTGYQIMAVYKKGDIPDPGPEVASSVSVYTNRNYISTYDLPSNCGDLLFDYVDSLGYSSVMSVLYNTDMSNYDKYNHLYVMYSVGERVFTVHYTIEFIDIINIGENIHTFTLKQLETLKYNGNGFATVSNVECSATGCFYLSKIGYTIDISIDIRNYKVSYFNAYYNYSPSKTVQVLHALVLASDN